MNELAYHCTIYIKVDENESMKDAANRLERILEADGIDYSYYDMELRNASGDAIDKEC